MRRLPLLLAATLTACSASTTASTGAPSPSSGPELAAPSEAEPAPSEAEPSPQPSRPPRAPASRPAAPTGTAGRLAATEQAIRDPRVTGASLTAAADRQQRISRRLTGDRARARRVIAALPRPLRAGVRDNVRAAGALRRLGGPVDRLPRDWRIVRPPPAADLRVHFRRSARRHGIPWEYLAAINLVETRMGRIRGTSVAGAQGPMQFMPATWEAYGRGDVRDAADAIDAAGRYLADWGAPGDMADALWHYNHSDDYVAAVTAYAERIRAEPRTYRGYHRWQVYVRTRDRGHVMLPAGWPS